MNRADITVSFSSFDLQEKIKYLLRQNSFHVQELNMQGANLIRSLLASPPNVLLADFDFFGISNLDTLRIIIEDKLCSVILVLNDAEKELIEGSIDTRDKLYMIQKPINKSLFLANIDFIFKSIEKTDLLEKEILNLKEVLETRKLVDRAKIVLMKNLGFVEEKAHRYIQKKSMETRRPIKELASEILKNGKIL